MVTRLALLCAACALVSCEPGSKRGDELAECFDRTLDVRTCWEYCDHLGEVCWEQGCHIGGASGVTFAAYQDDACGAETDPPDQPVLRTFCGRRFYDDEPSTRCCCTEDVSVVEQTPDIPRVRSPCFATVEHRSCVEYCKSLGEMCAVGCYDSSQSSLVSTGSCDDLHAGIGVRSVDCGAFSEVPGAVSAQCCCSDRK